MLRRNECRLNFKKRPVRTGDIKGGPKPPPPATNRGSQEPATNRVNWLHIFIIYTVTSIYNCPVPRNTQHNRSRRNSAFTDAQTRLAHSAHRWQQNRQKFLWDRLQIDARRCLRTLDRLLTEFRDQGAALIGLTVCSGGNCYQTVHSCMFLGMPKLCGVWIVHVPTLLPNDSEQILSGSWLRRRVHKYLMPDFLHISHRAITSRIVCWRPPTLSILSEPSPTTHRPNRSWAFFSSSMCCSSVSGCRVEIDLLFLQALSRELEVMRHETHVWQVIEFQQEGHCTLVAGCLWNDMNCINNLSFS